MAVAALCLELRIDLDRSHVTVLLDAQQPERRLLVEIIACPQRQLQAVVTQPDRVERGLRIVQDGGNLFFLPEPLQRTPDTAVRRVQFVGEEPVEQRGDGLDRIVVRVEGLRRIEDELRLGAGKGYVAHVDDIDILVDALAVQVALENRVLHLGRRLDRHQPDGSERAGSLAPEGGDVQVGCLQERFADEGDDDRFEAESLRLMDGHHAYGVLSVRGADALLAARFVPPLHETAQRRTVFFLIGKHLVEEGMDEGDVGGRVAGAAGQQTLASLVEGAAQGLHPGQFQALDQQPVDRIFRIDQGVQERDHLPDAGRGADEQRIFRHYADSRGNQAVGDGGAVVVGPDQHRDVAVTITCRAEFADVGQHA